jgi:hypothetical protein
MKWMTLLLVVLSVAPLHAWDPGMHVYLGSQTFQFWQNYDLEFFNDLNRPETDSIGLWTRKMYYIGLTLPDLLDEGVEISVCSLLTDLHGWGDTTINRIYYSIGVQGARPVGPGEKERRVQPLRLCRTGQQNAQGHCSQKIPVHSILPERVITRLAGF